MLRFFLFIKGAQRGTKGTVDFVELNLLSVPYN